MELWQFLGTLHPKLVQFPLVLLLLGLLFDAAGLLTRSSRARWAGLITTAAGTISLLFAFICGIYAEIWAGRSGVPQHPIELHELAANIAAWGFVILFAWRILLAEKIPTSSPQNQTAPKALRLYVILGLLWYSLLLLTGYLGGQLVFQYAAGVAAPHGPLSLSDLNTLASRQTDENLRYSEWMHHVFGFLPLVFAASLFAQFLWPAQQKRIKWIIPTCLLAGGIFLFIYADLDLYKFTDLHQWRDGEVQFHKTLASIMAIIGLVGLYKLRPWKKPPLSATSPLESGNSKLVAIIALIGGSLLFTHIHTVAPYANVAAGVYIAHVIMGLVALCIGAARLAQDYLPHWRKSLSATFAVLMLIQATLLLTYNEGLPWYIGYGKYDRWGYGDEDQRRLFTVAPFGDFRALMFVNQQQGKAFIAFHTSIPPAETPGGFVGQDDVALALDQPPQLLISRGTESDIALTMTKSREPDAPPDSPNAELTGANFQTQADFLKTTPYISARLVLTIKGQRLVGYFDPWVTPSITPVPPNEIASFICPMHDGVRATEAGKCPICGMDLIAIKPPRPPGELHDASYILKATLANGPSDAHASTRIILQMLDAAGKGVPLALTHEQRMHVIIVSQDLTYFDHLHPTELDAVAGSPITYALNYSFPRPGNYILFADVTPVGDRAQAFRFPLAVDNAGVRLSADQPSLTKPLILDEASKLVLPIPAPRSPNDQAPFDLTPRPAPVIPVPAAAVAGPGVAASLEPILAELTTQPQALYAGLHATLRFRLSDSQARPLTDLSPYLAAEGHCIIISQDTNTFVHCHAENLMPLSPDWRGGPEITFSAIFPAPGRYRLWAQFKRGDALIVAPFTVEVKSPPLPAALIRALLNE